ncbi:asparagine synthase-domain-containing protein [Desarmillaria tabescens]|uniref:Asparagine synthase-domain-containing protein n=1 Tax=Armillaria tabescens TaxID=1929756 RepID=A0AA39NH35_ARMTA|nr:asparagine synthase-domain-containing protein [Desarmillaria tabescens]KAK0465353.1 asparagine synthase-domain-containing protein [Desarmillaria tabescens]
MCGIFVCAQRFQVDLQTIDATDRSLEKLCIGLRHANAARGPDAQRSHKVSFKDQTSDDSILHLEFFASELCLRGSHPVVQPHIRNGDVLCWNGEIFEGLDMAPAENDGVKLFESSKGLKTPAQIRDLFSSVEGPYAFVFHHEESGSLIFGRDPLGRRSLLIHKPSSSHPYLMLTSVTSGADAGCSFEELPTDHIYCLNLKDLAQMEDMTFEDHLETLPRWPSQPTISSFAQPPKLNPSIPPDTWPRLVSLDEIPDYLLASVDDLISHLDRSVMLRVRNIPPRSSMPTESRVAVLFSGGIDSTVIAYLAHKHIPLEESIDLLNVAFENPRKIRMETEGNVGGVSRRHKKKDKKPSECDSVRVSYMVPDRKTGLQELEELRRLCPGRTWNFVEVNVPYHESQGARSIVEALMLPSRTVMDLSLALALYFASQGVGHVRAYPGTESVAYTSPARVLLNGLGSDELLGGYGRHRSAFNSGSWQAVIDELQLEIQRIPVRNLGRDDRICSSHGKETRHPFLSLGVVSFLANLPVQHKMDPRIEVGLGDKMLLRLAARKMGLIEASGRKKRAMQFGSHSARMDGDTKGDVTLD